MAKEMTIKELKEYYSRLKAERGTFEALWQEVADYFIPNRSQITTKKYHIAKDYLIPQELEKHGLKKDEVSINKATIELIVSTQRSGEIFFKQQRIK